MTTQTNFFNKIDKPKPQRAIIISTQQLAGDYWQAIIGQGWWIGFGKTKAQAIEKLKRNYEAESHLAPPKWWPVTDRETGQIK